MFEAKGSFYPRLLKILGARAYRKHIQTELSKIDCEIHEGDLEKYDDDLCLSRKQDFIAYKSYNPNGFYELESGIAWLNISTGIYYNIQVGDLFPKSGKTVIDLWNDVIDLAKRLNIGYTYFSISKNAGISKSFDDAGIAISKGTWNVVLDLNGINLDVSLAVKGSDDDMF